MPLIGEHVEEDRQLIADMVVSRMTQTLTTVGSSPSPLRPWVRTGGIFQRNQSNQVPGFQMTLKYILFKTFLIKKNLSLNKILCSFF